MLDAADPFVEALLRLDDGALKEMKAERPAEQFHKDLVMETIKTAKYFGVRFEPGAAADLDKLYAKAGSDVAEEPEASKNRQAFPGNGRRFSAMLVVFAEPAPKGSFFTMRSMESLKAALEMKLRGFCPCFPFCR